MARGAQLCAITITMVNISQVYIMGAKHVSERKQPGHTDTSTGPRCLLSIIHGQAETVLEELMSPQEENLIFDRAGFIAPPPHHR